MDFLGRTWEYNVEENCFISGAWILDLYREHGRLFLETEDINLSIECSGNSEEQILDRIKEKLKPIKSMFEGLKI